MYGNTVATDAQLNQVIEDAQLNDLIEQLPEGLETLSGGTWSEIIGRAKAACLDCSYIPEEPTDINP